MHSGLRFLVLVPRRSIKLSTSSGQFFCYYIYQEKRRFIHWLASATIGGIRLQTTLTRSSGSKIRGASLIWIDQQRPLTLSYTRAYGLWIGQTIEVLTIIQYQIHISELNGLHKVFHKSFLKPEGFRTIVTAFDVKLAKKTPIFQLRMGQVLRLRAGLLGNTCVVSARFSSHLSGGHIGQRLNKSNSKSGARGPRNGQ